MDEAGGYIEGEEAGSEYGNVCMILFLGVGNLTSKTSMNTSGSRWKTKKGSAQTMKMEAFGYFGRLQILGYLDTLEAAWVNLL